MNRPPLGFTASAIQRESRNTLGADVMVTVTHIPSSTTFMLTASEARQFAMCLLRATEQAKQPEKG